MKILIFEPINQLQKQIVNALISAGFEVIAVSQADAIAPDILKNSYDLLILDVDPDPKGMLEKLKDFQTNEKIKNLKTIAFTQQKNKKFLAGLVKLGVQGFIPKPFKEKIFIAFLDKILKRIFPDDPKAKERRHVRVSPLENDTAEIVVRTPGTFKVVTGVIENLSMGGILFNIHRDVIKDIPPKSILKNFQIKINSTVIQSDVFVVAAKDTHIAVKFHKIAPYDKNILSGYIYNVLETQQKNSH